MTNYVMPDEFHVLRRENRFLYLDPVNHSWVVTDEIGNYILENKLLSEGKESAVDALVFAGGGEIDKGSAIEYVDTFVKSLVNVIIYENKYVRKNIFDKDSTYPQVMYLHLTSSCNLACKYCYNQEHRSSMNTSKRSLSKEYRRSTAEITLKFKEALEEAAKLGVRFVKITGGEATLYKDFLEVSAFAKSVGMDVNLLTNGTLINRELAEKIKCNVDSISISLDSKDPSKHDFIRGKGTHKKVVEAINIFREVGLKDLHVNGVVTPLTVSDVEEFLEYATDNLGAQTVTLAGSTINVLDPNNRWGSSGQKLSPEEHERYQSASRNFSKRRSEDASVPFRNHCGVGDGVISIDSNGDVYPCQTLHSPEFLCGNVFESSLRDIIHSSNVISISKSASVDNIDGCKTCPVRYICASGCRSDAYTNEGEFMAKNKEACPIYFKSAIDRLWDSVD
jgi:radical SAM protein with 4Fe4S-binding SPASM domain